MYEEYLMYVLDVNKIQQHEKAMWKELHGTEAKGKAREKKCLFAITWLTLGKHTDQTLVPPKNQGKKKENYNSSDQPMTLFIVIFSFMWNINFHQK